MINPHLMANMELYRRGKLPPANKSMVEELYKRNNPELLDIAQRYGEPVLAMLSQAVLEPVSGLAGLGATIAEGPEAGADVVRRVQDLAYTPSAKGQESLEQLQQTLMETPIIGDYLQTAAEAPGDIGEMIYQKTGNPLFAALGEGTTAAALELGIPAKGAKVVTGPVNKADVYSPKIFAGYRARTADAPAYTKAQQMTEGGASPWSVWRETGWRKDVDDNWKFEIDDSEAVWNPNEALNLQNQQNMIDGLPFKSFEDRVAFNLSDVLKHDKLYEAYPDAKNIKIMSSPYMSFGTRGEYNPKTDVITLSNDIFQDLEQGKSTALHEIQHAVQERENFARGGSNEKAFTDQVKAQVANQASEYRQAVDDWNTNHADLLLNHENAADVAQKALMFKDFERLIDYSKKDNVGSVTRHIRNAHQWNYVPTIGKDDALRQRANQLDLNWYNLPKQHRKAERGEFLRNQSFAMAQLLRDAIGDDLFKRFKDDPRQLNSMVKALERDASKARAELAPLQEIRQERNRAGTLEEATKYKTPTDIYRALAGEAEARNVQTRMDLTPEERRQKNPTLTLDVKQHEQIPYFWQGGVRLPQYE